MTNPRLHSAQGRPLPSFPDETPSKEAVELAAAGS